MYILSKIFCFSAYLLMFIHVYFRWTEATTTICHTTLNNVKTRFIVWIFDHLKSEEILDESKILVQNFCTLKNKYGLMLSITLHTASETFDSGSIFCVFTSVASILIGKDDEYEKKIQTPCARTFTLFLMKLTKNKHNVIIGWQAHYK